MIPGLSEAIGAGTSLLGGWLQQRAARKAAEEQRRAGTAAAAQLTASAGESAGRIGQAGEAAATGFENAGNTAMTQVGEAGRQGQEAIGGALQRFNPYSDAGADALRRLQAGVAQGGEFSQNFDGNIKDFTNDAGFQFRLNQGIGAISNSAAARGLRGGNTFKAMEDYRQGLASTEAGEAFNRARSTFQMNRENALNPLTALVGVGERANNSIMSGTQAGANLGFDTARTVGGIGMDTARGAGGFRMGATSEAEGLRQRAEQQAADLRTGAAASGAAGTIGAGNAWADALTNVGRSIDFGSLGRRRRPASTPQAPTTSPGFYAFGGGSGG